MEFRKYLMTITKITPETTNEQIDKWFECAKVQTMYQWTEHVLVYSDWKKIMGKFKPKKNFRMIPDTEPAYPTADTILTLDWPLNEVRDEKHHERSLEQLWLKYRKQDETHS